jgi:hypothetical protein
VKLQTQLTRVFSTTEVRGGGPFRLLLVGPFLRAVINLHTSHLQPAFRLAFGRLYGTGVRFRDAQ